MEYNKNIPKDFHELDNDDFIKECKVCQKHLPENDNQYLLEKAVKRFPDIEARETVFEYAICLECAGSKRDSLSKESKQKIQDYFTSDEIQSRSFDIFQRAVFSGQRPMDYCMITGKSIQEVKEYQIIAHCKGNSLFPGTEALMISGEGLEVISGLLSESTKDELDRFKDEHFGVPPEFEKILNPTDLILC